LASQGMEIGLLAMQGKGLIITSFRLLVIALPEKY
jgi:hypothetical protein